MSGVELSAEAGLREAIEGKLVALLMDEYGEGRSTWTEFGSTRRIAKGILGVLAAHEAPSEPEGETVTEFGVTLADDDELVLDGLMHSGALLILNRRDSLPLRKGRIVTRTRTTYPDRVTEWEVVTDA